MYANCINGIKWSNATVISDKWEDGSEWNTGNSGGARIDINGSNIHVVWYDDTDGIWGDDLEIMYTIVTLTSGNGKIYVPGSGGGGGGSSSTKSSGENIPGYDIYILLGVIALFSIVFRLTYLKKLNIFKK